MSVKINQLPAIIHVAIQHGDHWWLSITIDDMDLTGHTITAAIHPKGGGEDVALTIEETDLAAGEFTLVLTAEASASLPPDHHSWCTVITPPLEDPEADPRPRTFFAGRFIVEACR